MQPKKSRSHAAEKRVLHSMRRACSLCVGWLFFGLVHQDKTTTRKEKGTYTLCLFWRLQLAISS